MAVMSTVCRTRSPASPPGAGIGSQTTVCQGHAGGEVEVWGVLVGAKRRALMPRWAFSDLYASMVACPDDLAVRWFLLCGLCEAKRPLQLYGSREEAEQDTHSLNRK
jgi:hypothetical protein